MIKLQANTQKPEKISPQILFSYLTLLKAFLLFLEKVIIIF